MSDALISRSALRNPSTWADIAARLSAGHPGPRFCHYDLSDSSEATDVAQLACEALAAMLDESMAGRAADGAA